MPERKPSHLPVLERMLALPATDLHTALAQVSQLLAEALGSDKIDCFLLNPLTSTLFAVGTSDTAMSRQQRALGLDTLPLANGGRVVQVFQTGAPHHDGRVDQDEGELLGMRQALGIRSTIAVALEVGGDRRGVLQASSATPEFFSEEDLRYLAAAARWVGAVAHRAELVDEMSTQAGERARQETAEELVTMLAHDLGNLLAPLAAHLELLVRRAAREQRSADLGDAQAAGRIVARLQRLMADVLDVARIDEGIFALAERPLDLVALGSDVARTLRTPTVEVQLHGPVECIVSADPARLRQALENVVSNALRHSAPGQAVRLEVAEERRGEERWVRVTVSDQGPGIPAELQARLFERFAHGPTSGGLGLGLFLTRGIVEAHGGQVDVESSPDSGTRVTLTLPAAPDPRL